MNTTDYWTATATATTGAYVFPVKHKPGFRLSAEERDKKSDLHKFGLCCDCDAGLDDRADFIVCDPAEGDCVLMCNACHEYYTEGPCYAHEG